MASGMSLTRVIMNTAVVLAVLGLAWVLVQIRSIVFLLLLGIVFAAAIEPLVYSLRRAGLRRGQAILVVYAGLLAIAGVGFYLLIPALVGQIAALDAAIPEIFDKLRQQALESGNRFLRQTGYQTLMRIENTYIKVRNGPEIGQDQALGAATSALGIIFTIVSLMIVAFYWMTEKATIKRVVLELIPFSKRARAHAIWDEIEYRIGGWTRGQLLLMVMIGLCSGAAYYIIDLRYWLALAIWAGLTEAVPFIGPFIGGGTAALIALADSPEKALQVVIFATILQQLEGAVLVPRVMRDAVGMSPLTVILAVLVGGTLAGLQGSLLAIPVGAAVQVLVSNLLRHQDDQIASELRTMDIAPLSAAQLGSPFAPPEGTRSRPHSRVADDAPEPAGRRGSGQPEMLGGAPVSQE